MLAFMMKAAVSGLKQFPEFNSSLSPDKDALILKRYYHVGVAVDTPEGLVVPVIRDVDRKGIHDLSRELGAISKKARDGKLSPSDLQGGSFTISSLGGSRVMRDYFLVGVSKAALEAVTRYLAVELAAHGVRVNAVSGGLVETDALKSFSWGPEVIEQMLARTPAGRMVTPEDIANVVAFLCSQRSAMPFGLRATSTARPTANTMDPAKA